MCCVSSQCRACFFGCRVVESSQLPQLCCNYGIPLPGPSCEPSTSIPRAVLVPQPWLSSSLSPEAHPCCSAMGEQHFLPRLPPWAGTWGSMARKRGFHSCSAPSQHCSGATAPRGPTSIEKLWEELEVSLHPWDGALQALEWSRALSPGLSFPLKCIQPWGDVCDGTERALL